MDFVELGKKIIGMGAPLLGGAVGGPGGAALGGIIASVLGGDPNDPDDLARRVAADPEAAVKLHEVESAHKERLEEISLDRYKADLEDRDSARSREIATTKATGKRDINLYILAYTYVVGFFVATIAMIVLVLTGKFPSDTPEYVVFLLGSLFGSLTAGATAIIQYFFGSSKGSSDKTALIAGGK